MIDGFFLLLRFSYFLLWIEFWLGYTLVVGPFYLLFWLILVPLFWVLVKVPMNVLSAAFDNDADSFTRENASNIKEWREEWEGMARDHFADGAKAFRWLLHGSESN